MDKINHLEKLGEALEHKLSLIQQGKKLGNQQSKTNQMRLGEYKPKFNQEDDPMSEVDELEDDVDQEEEESIPPVNADDEDMDLEERTSSLPIVSKKRRRVSDWQTDYFWFGLPALF